MPENLTQHTTEQSPTEQEHSERERSERRHTDRERLRDAAEQLLTPEGWMRWVQARATLRGYSSANCMLLAQQCHERGIVPERVGGLHAWRKLGRHVREGETALRISAPIAFKLRDEGGHETGERRVFFKTAFVFELSQTEPLPGREVQAFQLRPEPLNGNSHAYLLAPLRAFAESLGYSVSLRTTGSVADGWCDTKRKQIVLDRRAPANAQVRALIHECVHALGVDYRHYPLDRAEVIADTVAFVVAAGAGLAADTASVPYLASWGANGEIEAVSEFAQTIDRLARHIEREALGL